MEINAKMVKELREKTNSGMMDCKKALKECDGDMEKAVDWLRQKGLMTARKRAGRATREGLIVAEVSADQKTGVALELNCETDFVAKNEGFQKLAKSIADFLLSAPVPADLPALMAAKMADGRTVDEAVKALVGTIGENMNLRRFVVKKAGDGQIVHAYIHGPGKIGVLVELAAEKPGEAATGLAHDIALQVAAANPAALDEDGIPADMLEREKDIYRAKLKEQGKPEKMWDKIMQGQIKKFYSEVTLVHQAFVKDPAKAVSDVVKEAGCGAAIKGFTRYQLGEELPGEENEAE